MICNSRRHSSLEKMRLPTQVAFVESPHTAQNTWIIQMGSNNLWCSSWKTAKLPHVVSKDSKMYIYDTILGYALGSKGAPAATRFHRKWNQQRCFRQWIPMACPPIDMIIRTFRLGHKFRKGGTWWLLPMPKVTLLRWRFYLHIKWLPPNIQYKTCFDLLSDNPVMSRYTDVSLI